MAPFRLSGGGREPVEARTRKCFDCYPFHQSPRICLHSRTSRIELQTQGAGMLPLRLEVMI